MYIDGSDEAPLDSKNQLGRSATRSITAVDDATGSIRRVEAIAERIRELFHRDTIEVPGQAVWMSDALGPSETPTDGTVYARTVTVRLAMLDE